MLVIYIAVIAMAIWHLVFGFRAGTMSALGQVYATANRSKQPIRFWLFGLFNVLLLFAGILLAVSEMRK